MKELFWIIVWSGLIAPLPGQELYKESKQLILMGCAFEITAVDTQQENAWQAINGGIKEIERIEHIISSWKVNSQTSEINRNAGKKPVHVSKELFDLIFRARKISRLTGGAFDISFASMDKIWSFNKQEAQFPHPDTVSRAASKIDWQNIILNTANQTVYLKLKGMKIGFGAIGKGYAANKALALMKSYGIKGACVNASGDLLTWGESGTDKPWRIHIQDPDDTHKALAWLNVQDQAVVTSGNYEKYIRINGKRYAHIIDPRTGYPVSGVKSVTLICPDAELADALATSVFVLGLDEGMSLVDRLKNVECIIVSDTGKMHYSKNVAVHFIP